MAASAEILAFPTSRKKAYPHRYVPREQLPPNAVRLEAVFDPPRTPLTARGLKLLVEAMLSNMTFVEHHRILTTLDRWATLSHCDDDIASAKNRLLFLPARPKEP